ncbi:MAG: hypothetical protein JRJ87_13940 [Deltaproteobacteria bacterium]|nr:hypothetical protein [Deltaproteobacteria bacterium]
MNRPRRQSVGHLFGLIALFLVVSGTTYARRAKTISFIPDPSCRANKLVVIVEEVLATHLKVKDLKIIEKEKVKAQVLMQYFIIERNQGDQLTIQLDGRAFGNYSGKLLAEGSATSDPFSNDENGRQAAAKQAAQQLAQSLSAALEESLWAKGKGRRIMLQVTLEGQTGSLRPAIVQGLKKALMNMSPKFKGSTPSNLIIIFHSSEGVKDLVESLGRVLKTGDEIKISWLVQSKNTLMVSLSK